MKEHFSLTVHFIKVGKVHWLGLYLVLRFLKWLYFCFMITGSYGNCGKHGLFLVKNGLSQHWNCKTLKTGFDRFCSVIIGFWSKRALTENVANHLWFLLLLIKVPSSIYKRFHLSKQFSKHWKCFSMNDPIALHGNLCSRCLWVLMITKRCANWSRI